MPKTTNRKDGAVRRIKRATPEKRPPVKTPPKKQFDVRAFVVPKYLTAKSKVESVFSSVVNKVKRPRKAPKKLTKADRKLAMDQKIRGIIGIGLLFVVVSIAYSTYMTNLFVDGSAMVIALAPQVLFALATFVIAFYKILK